MNRHGYYGGGNNRSRGRVSYSRRKRDKMDYRAAYFAHNPGLFGVIWFCAYCHKPIIGKHNVQVDHIMPLNNPFGKNARYNLVAACPECNRNKSDKVDIRVVEGYTSKLLEMVIFGAQKIAVVGIVGLWATACFIGRGIKGILLRPFINTSGKTKLIALVVYAIVAWFIYKSLTDGGF